MHKTFIETIDTNMARIGQLREFFRHGGNGWISDIRKALGLTLANMGKIMEVSGSAVADHENNERNGTITISTLEKYAKAFNLEFVYGFCHNGNTLEQIIDERAETIAMEIIEATIHTMRLEGEHFDEDTLRKRLAEQKYELKKNPKNLWH